MPSTRDIRRRIKSVKNTAQITRAMQMVAAAKMRKAQDQAQHGRSYATLMNKVLVSLKDQAEDTGNPFFTEGPGKKDLYLVITPDKGLCGPMNTNLLRKLFQETKGADADFVTIGRKGALALGRAKKKLLADFPVKDPATFREVRVASRYVQERFLTGEYRSVRVVFTNFINTVTVIPTIETLLPIDRVALGGKRAFEEVSHLTPEEKKEESPALVYDFEPSPEAVFDSLLPHYVNHIIFQMLLESRAAEHSSRMVAMKNATDNAKQLIKDLTLEYNKIRQASITNELLEITTAKLALE
jgi:F-type H+-transporting ATPase subunit gamma